MLVGKNISTQSHYITKDTMIDRLIFLHHGAISPTVGTSSSGGGSGGFIVLGLLVLLVVGLWISFTKKK